MDGKNLTPQNAPGSTVGNPGGVLPPQECRFLHLSDSLLAAGLLIFKCNDLDN